jgi:zinc protease
VTPAGVRVLVLGDGSAPLVSVQAAWVARGDELDGAGDEAAPVLAALLARGTRTRSGADVAAEARAIGGTLKGFAAPGTLGLRADFLPQHLGRGLALIADCLAHPAFGEADVDAAERARSVRARDEARRTDAGGVAALRLLRETLWPDAARPADAAAAPAPGRFALLDRYRRRYPPSRLIIAVVGDVDPGAVAAAFADAFPGSPPPGEGRGEGQAPRPQPVALPTAQAPAPPAAPRAEVQPVSPVPAVRGDGDAAPVQPTTVFRASTGADATAAVGYPTFAAGDPNRPAMDVLAEILAGEDGRLAAAIAREQTLACRAGAQTAAAPAPGFLAVTVSCPPAQLDAAVAAARAVLARLAADGVTPDEVTRAARRLAGARAAALRTQMSVADALVRDEGDGLAMLSYRRASAALARVAAADVSRAARAALDPRREVVAVVRPANAPALAKTAAKPGKAESER